MLFASKQYFKDLNNSFLQDRVRAELFVDNYWIKRLPSQFDNFGNDQIEKNTYGNSSATKVDTRCFAYPKKLLAEMPASALKSGKA